MTHGQNHNLRALAFIHRHQLKKPFRKKAEKPLWSLLGRASARNKYNCANHILRFQMMLDHKLSRDGTGLPVTAVMLNELVQAQPIRDRLW